MKEKKANIWAKQVEHKFREDFNNYSPPRLPKQPEDEPEFIKYEKKEKKKKIRKKKDWR